MNAIILSVGDELVLGQTVDTNSAWLSQQLAAVGCDIAGHATIPDDQTKIEKAIIKHAAECDFLIISGGIGPTEDDLTRQALAAVLNQPLELNEHWLKYLEDFFQKRGRPMPPTNKIQAMIPRGAVIITNTAGTASGIRCQLPAANCQLFAIPGVPKEMKVMFTRDILPIVAKETGGSVILSTTLNTFGQGESTVAEKLGPLMNRERNPSVGTTVADGIVSLRINARFPNREQAQAELDQTAEACRAKLGDVVFGQDDETLPVVVGKLLKDGPAAELPGHLLARDDEYPSRALMVCTAESCTGGLLAKMLTDIPGSSAYFKQGWVTYSNKAKYERLGVSMEIINMHGAVSEPVVESMARNARRLASADLALAISGIAGPDGGSPTKPVGTVCIALAIADPADKKQSIVQTRTFNFPGDREMIRDRSAKMALTLLRFHLLTKPLPF